MKKCLYVEELAIGAFQTMTMGSERLFKAGPVLDTMEDLYWYAKENEYTDVFFIKSYLHIGEN